MIEIKISRDFKRAPGPRLIREGKNSGELFRNEILRDAVRRAIAEGQRLTVNLDGTAGYGKSFLDEAFGGLIRKDKIPYADIIGILDIVSNDQPNQRDKVFGYLRTAHEKEQGQLVSSA